jgi:hypothetical protein
MCVVRTGPSAPGSKNSARASPRVGRPSLERGWLVKNLLIARPEKKNLSSGHPKKTHCSLVLKKHVARSSKNKPVARSSKVPSSHSPKEKFTNKQKKFKIQESSCIQKKLINLKMFPEFKKNHTNDL